MAQRICQRCGKVYWRRQAFEVWDKRNPGHKDGWRKVIIRLCLDCQDPATTGRILEVALVRILERSGNVRALPSPEERQRKSA